MEPRPMDPYHPENQPLTAKVPIAVRELGGGPPPVEETLQSRVTRIEQVVYVCHDLMGEIETRVHGPAPVTGSGEIEKAPSVFLAGSIVRIEQSLSALRERLQRLMVTL